MAFFMTLITCAIAFVVVRALKGDGSAGGTGRPPHDSMKAGAPGGPPPPRPQGQEPKRLEDSTLGDPLARRLATELAGGAWPEVEKQLDQTRDWGRRGFLVQALAEHHGLKGAERQLDAWVKARPDSASAHLVRGRWFIRAAWDRRGGGGAETVTAAGWKGFGECLLAADRDLERAARLDPVDPTPWAARVIIAMGDSRGPRAREWFEEARRRDPWNVPAHRALLSDLCAKWHGSHEAMFQLARESSAKAPQGSGVHGLVPQAHLERWLHAGHFAKSKQEDPWFGRTDGYWKEAAVRDEVNAALARLGGERNVTTVHARNAFAVALFLMDETVRLRPLLEGLEGQWLEIPWAWLNGGARAAVQAACKQAGIQA
jgi:hypothetical protein